MSDIDVDTYGHVTGLATRNITLANLGYTGETNATADQTITAGSGLTGGGTGNVTLSHSDTSSQASVNNSGATIIQDVTLDTYGHVTGLASKALSYTDVGAQVAGTYNTVIGTDSDINTSGSTIVDNIFVTDGVITSMGTRTLTLGDLGYTGATNANYITNNNQLTNGAGYVNTSDSRLSDARQCNNTFNNPTTSRNNLGLGTGNGVTFASVSAGSFSGDGSALTGIAVSLAPAYDSGEVSYGSGITTVNHGLGRVPYFWNVRLRCKTANNGYSVGDEIFLGSMVDGDGARGYVSWANSTYIKYSIDNVNIQNTSADYAGTTASYWRLIFYAW